METEIYKMVYKINKNMTNLTILGEEFAKNNKNKGKLVIKNKKFRLKNIIKIEDNKKTIFKIKMILRRNIYNKCSLFKNCDSLLQFYIDDKMDNFLSLNNNCDDSENKEKEKYLNIDSNYSESIFNIKLENNIDEDSVISRIEESLNYSTIEGIKNKFENIKMINYTILNEAFYNCKLLTSLPDISNWNITNV